MLCGWRPAFRGGVRKAGTGARPSHRLAVRIRQRPGRLSGAASWAGCDLLPKLNFNPAHKSSRSVPCYPLRLTPAWAGMGIASSDGLCSCGAAGSVCPGEKGRSCTDRPGDPASHRPLGLAKGPAWLSRAEALSSVGGPEGLGQGPSGAVGSSSVRRVRVQITAPPLPRQASLGGFPNYPGPQSAQLCSGGTTASHVGMWEGR